MPSYVGTTSILFGLAGEELPGDKRYNDIDCYDHCTEKWYRVSNLRLWFQQENHKNYIVAVEPYYDCVPTEIKTFEEMDYTWDFKDYRCQGN